MSNNWLWTLSCCLRFISASLWSMATASVFSRTNRKSSSKIPPGKKKVVCNDIPNTGRLQPVQSVLCRRFLASGKWHSQPKLWFLPSKHCHFHTQWNFMAVVRSKWIRIHPFKANPTFLFSTLHRLQGLHLMSSQNLSFSLGDLIASEKIFFQLSTFN